MPTITRPRPFVPADLRAVDNALRAGRDATRPELVARIAAKIADDDRFTATMNRGDWRSADVRADELLARYERASKTAREGARRVLRKIDRELGIRPRPFVA